MAASVTVTDSGWHLLPVVLLSEAQAAGEVIMVVSERIHQKTNAHHMVKIYSIYKKKQLCRQSS